ncbi:hypothetical protein PHYC_02503 [Phycisphaerales bacterium]|nr:hypothetical protein PHYC_02503 [Phycisphaerales bacterium]
MLSRREFLVMAAAAGAGAGLGARVARARTRRDETFFEWKTLREGVVVALGYGGNAMVVKGKDGGLLVDCKNAPYGTTLRREAEIQCGKLLAIINTHHHADHTGGNHAFTGDIPTYAHEKGTPRVLGQMNRYVSQAKEAPGQLEGKTGEAVAKARIEALAYYKHIEERKAADYAARTGVGDSHSLEVAGVKMALRHFVPGHTDNDMMGHLPDLNVVHAGDLLFHRMHPFVDANGGGDTAGWVTSVRKIIEVCDAKTIVVPGHGEPTDVSGLRGQVEYFVKMRDAVAKAVKDGKSRQEVGEMDPGVYADYGAANRRAMVMQAIFDEMAAKK